MEFLILRKYQIVQQVLELPKLIKYWKELIYKTFKYVKLFAMI